MVNRNFIARSAEMNKGENSEYFLPTFVAY